MPSDSSWHLVLPSESEYLVSHTKHLVCHTKCLVRRTEYLVSLGGTTEHLVIWTDLLGVKSTSLEEILIMQRKIEPLLGITCSQNLPFGGQMVWFRGAERRGIFRETNLLLQLGVLELTGDSKTTEKPKFVFEVDRHKNKFHLICILSLEYWYV